MKLFNYFILVSTLLLGGCALLGSQEKNSALFIEVDYDDHSVMYSSSRIVVKNNKKTPLKAASFSKISQTPTISAKHFSLNLFLHNQLKNTCLATWLQQNHSLLTKYNKTFGSYLNHNFIVDVKLVPMVNLEQKKRIDLKQQPYHLEFYFGWNSKQCDDLTIMKDVNTALVAPLHETYHADTFIDGKGYQLSKMENERLATQYNMCDQWKSPFLDNKMVYPIAEQIARYKQNPNYKKTSYFHPWLEQLAADLDISEVNNENKHIVGQWCNTHASTR